MEALPVREIPIKRLRLYIWHKGEWKEAYNPYSYRLARIWASELRLEGIQVRSVDSLIGPPEGAPRRIL